MRLSGCVLTVETNLAYVLDAPWLLTYRDPRLTGTRWLVFPADASRMPILIATDLDRSDGHGAGFDVEFRPHGIWTESRDSAVLASHSAQMSRPEQWDEDALREIVRRAFADLDLSGSRLGTDLELAPSRTAAWLQSLVPHSDHADITDVLLAMRSIKDSRELAILREDVALQELGMAAALESFVVGVTHRELDLAYVSAVLAGADRRSGGSAPETFMSSSLTLAGKYVQVAEVGSVFKMDCGVRIAGYTSDGGRTACIAPVPAKVEEVHQLLAAAHEVGRHTIRPGIAASELFATLETFIRANGLPGYSRGHFGHSVGLGGFTEEPPYISATDHTILQPGMVLALETPLYAGDLGNFQIEDLLLVTESGAELLNRLEHGLTVVP
jgi:Xaa-Pro aminopeptidase